MTTPQERKHLNDCIRHMVICESKKLSELMRQSQCRHQLVDYGGSKQCTQCDFYAGDLWRAEFKRGLLT